MGGGIVRFIFKFPPYVVDGLPAGIVGHRAGVPGEEGGPSQHSAHRRNIAKGKPLEEEVLLRPAVALHVGALPCPWSWGVGRRRKEFQLGLFQQQQMEAFGWKIFF